MVSQLSFISSLVISLISIVISSNASGIPADTYISVSEFRKYCQSFNYSKAMLRERQSFGVTGKFGYLKKMVFLN
jgi:hypothetical protein